MSFEGAELSEAGLAIEGAEANSVSINTDKEGYDGDLAFQCSSSISDPKHPCNDIQIEESGGVLTFNIGYESSGRYSLVYSVSYKRTS